jgi:hypothetical protein
VPPDELEQSYPPPGRGHSWLVNAADLLAEPDPGPTPWLIDKLIVDKALVAAVGRWKTTKSYGLLDMCISIVSGRPAFGTLDVPNPGPVVFVNEESGRTALLRRLDALCRGRAIDREEVRDLHLAANTRIKLDEGAWWDELIDVGRDLRPRLFVFDPLARMKGATREENAQTEMATVIEFLRQLRDDSGAGVLFVHHTGHAGRHMRGTSDLESAWETRLQWTRDGQSPLVTVESEHREAEASEPLQYRIAWDADTRSMRFNLVEQEAALPPLTDRVLDYLREHPNQRVEEIAKGLQTRTSDVRRTLRASSEAGTTHEGPSGRRDGAGRPIRDKVWNLSNEAPLWPVPQNGTTQDDPQAGHRGSVARPVSIGDGPRDEPPDEPHDNGHEMADTDEDERLAALFHDTEPAATKAGL